MAEAAARSDSDRPTTLRISRSSGSPSQAAVELPADAPRLTVGFADRSFKIDGRSSAVDRGLRRRRSGRQDTHTIVVNAYAYSGEGAISEARRLAYYRGMMARKQLVDVKVKPENIRINVNDTADKSKGMTVELIVAGTAH